VYIRPGTTLAYLLTNLGLVARMIVDGLNRTIRRTRDMLASVTLDPSDTPGSCTLLGASALGCASGTGAPVPGSALSDVPFVSRGREFQSRQPAGAGRCAYATGPSPRREVAVRPSSISGMLKA
jgi:hypothetical protein